MAAADLSRRQAPEWAAPGRAAFEWPEDAVSPEASAFRVSVVLILSLTFFVSFRKRKGDEVDGIDEVTKKKSKKEKDKEIRLEKALKVSPELRVSSRHSV